MEINMFKKIVLIIQSIFNRNEIHLLNSNINIDNQPIFIIGAPRTGSTVLFQLLISRYKLVYISNLMALMPMFLSLIGRITLNSLLAYNEIKDSNYGFIKGLHSPNEAGKVSERWFSKNEFNKHLYLSIARLSNKSKCSIVIKSLGNSLKIEEIMATFPNAKFIFLKRSLFSNAQSLIEARFKVNKDINKWFSIRPKGYLKILKEMNPIEQVVWQIRTINRIIESKIKIYPYNFIKLDYEDLCENPQDELLKIEEFLNLEVKESDDNLYSKVNLRERKATNNELDVLLEEALNKVVLDEIS
jgi:hypothetical protein